METFATRCRAVMNEREISQSELQRRLTAKGFSTGYTSVQAWIHGRSDPSLVYAKAIAQTLDVSLDYLVGLKEYR